MKRDIKNIRRIKARMVVRGVTTVDIAREAGVSRTWVSLVLHGHKRSKKVERAIAQAVGKPVEELWPNNNRAA